MLFHANADDNYPYRIRILWKIGDTINDWDQKCIWAIETYGLPGVKYITHLTEDYMDFCFKNEKDAVHFGLVCQ